MPDPSRNSRDGSPATKSFFPEAVGFYRGRSFLGRVAVRNHQNQTESIREIRNLNVRARRWVILLPRANLAPPDFARELLEDDAQKWIASRPGRIISSLETSMKRILYAAFFAFLLANSGYAAPGGDISGTVKGEDGAPFRAAFVRAQNAKTKLLMMVLTNNQGQYRTDNLPAGTYEVWATSTGYRSDPSRRTDVTVQDGKSTSASFTMKKGAVQWSQLTKYQAGILLPDAKGKDVVLQECFNCHAMSRIGVMGADRGGWLEASETS